MYSVTGCKSKPNLIRTRLIKVNEGDDVSYVGDRFLTIRHKNRKKVPRHNDSAANESRTPSKSHQHNIVINITVVIID